MHTQEYIQGAYLTKELTGLVTFKDFQKLMKKRKRSVDDLVDLFHGKLEENRDFFERAMSCQRRNSETRRFEDLSGVVIPYKSVCQFYYKEKHYQEDLDGEKTA